MDTQKLVDPKWLKILVHISTWFAPVLLPLIVFLVSDDRSVRKLSLQALLFHVMMWVLAVIGFALIIVLIGIPMLIVLGIAYVVVPFMGIIRAWQGRDFDYPIVRAFIR
ncbi:DUF4870 domain-containing protein [Staphylospora marina]|uniref:DUF4870 domain-containing protein n=1 Tax=Staphylospora marina TaxID=2490858 RepID=UPI001F150957|nr:DUF4870 domain-containing protein [Staphylospora marina]